MILLACATAICLLTAVPAATAEGERPKLEKSDLKKLRKQAANRPRRIVYNDDGCHGPSRNTPQELLACRVRQVTDTQVDTICYCTGGGGLFWAHQPNVGEVLGASVEEGHAPYVKQMRDGLIAMKKQGTDPLAVVVEHGHKHKMEVFWSYRMNNPECSFVSWALSKRKRNNPEYIMGVKADWKKYPPDRSQGLVDSLGLSSGRKSATISCESSRTSASDTISTASNSISSATRSSSGRISKANRSSRGTSR